MKAFQKVIVFALVFSLTITMLAACEDKVKDEDVKKSVMVYTEPAAVKFIFSNLHNQPTISKNILSEIENCTRDTLNLELEFTSFSGEYFESLTKYYDKITSLIEGEGTDVIGVDGNLSSLASRGLLLDITDLLPEYAPNLYKSFTPEQLAAGTYNGRLYMIPGRKNGSGRTAVLVRKELVERFGLQPIKTFDDYERFMEFIKKEAPDYYPAGKLFISPYAFIMASGYIRATGNMVYRWNDPYMALMPVEQTEEYYEAMTRLISWNMNGYFDPAPMTPEQTFRSDKIASIMLVLDIAIDNLKSYGLSSEFVIYPLNPHLYAEGGDGSAGGIALTKAAEEPERILKLLEWIYSSQENYDLLMYGVKGKDYALNGERVVMPEGKTYRSWCGSDFFFYSKYMRLLDDDPVEMKAYYSGELDPRTIIPPHKGFRSDLSKLQALIDQRNKLFGQEWGIIMGTNDMTIDDHINALREAGADVLRDEIQRQLNEWLEERDQ